MARRTKRIIKTVALSALAALATFVLYRCYRHLRGIEVCLHNVDSQPLRSVEVSAESSISTRWFAVGTLEPDETSCVWVKADHEATVRATFMTPSGTVTVVPLAGYVEQGYSGWISADVTAGGGRSIEQAIDFF